jgi:SAM-dependent methyltransferase
MDLSETAIEIARTRHPGVDFAARDLFAGPLPGGQDLVVASEVIEHVEDQPGFVALLVDAVRPGGFVLLTTPNGRVEARWKRRPAYAPQPIEKWLSPEALRRLLEDRCRVRWLTTFLYDFARDGPYALIHHPRYERVVSSLGLAAVADRFWGACGLGLYTVALACKR